MMSTVPEDLNALDDAELARRIELARATMRPVENQLAALRADHDVLVTERRRRERSAHRESRAGLKAAMREGQLATLSELAASGLDGGLDAFAYHLKTGGEVRLGYPGAKTQSLAMTDGNQVAQVTDLARAAELYAAGWEFGSPGRPGVRVHFPGTRQERLINPDEIHARHLDEARQR